jgi:ABC-type phosphate transport system substrate-binding protein
MIRKFILAAILTTLLSCGDNKFRDPGTDEIESMNSGKITVYCDDMVYPVLDTVFEMYRDVYPNVTLTEELVNARDAMTQLLSNEARIVITGRTFLKDEDSLMKVYDVERPSFELAQDGLVFYCHPDFPLDTLNASDLEEIFTSEEKFGNYYGLEQEPDIYINDYTSSVFAHFNRQVIKEKPLREKINFISTIDSIKNIVSENTNAVGIGFLSHVVKNPKFKILRIGFTYPDGAHELPQVVHQSFILQERYPYIVNYYAFLREERKNQPHYWLATFLEKDKNVVRYYKEAGIVPRFAKFEIIKED